MTGPLEFVARVRRMSLNGDLIGALDFAESVHRGLQRLTAADVGMDADAFAEAQTLAERAYEALAKARILTEPEGGDAVKTDEAAVQRRLARDAQTVCLGTLYHERATSDIPFARARVEVSYGDDENASAGFYRVIVPSVEPTGDPDVDLESHPATLARDVARAHLEQLAEERGWEWWEVDDVVSA